MSNAIVERQKNFFVHGELAMRPLVLREIADELGLHESTISRVTTAKYMSTPYGTVELKYFFGSALGTETGGNASSTAVRALIKQFVAAERPEEAAVRQPDLRHAQGAGHRVRAPHGRQVPRGAAHRARQPAQGLVAMSARPGPWPQWMRLGLALTAVLLLASGCAMLPAEFERTPSRRCRCPPTPRWGASRRPRSPTPT